MTDAPERFWLTNFTKDQYGARLGRGTVSDLDHNQNPDYPEYIRKDLSTYDAGFAEGIKAAKKEYRRLQTGLPVGASDGQTFTIRHVSAEEFDEALCALAEQEECQR